MNKIKKGDMVIVIAGKDRGKRGIVMRVEIDKTGKLKRVMVEAVNKVYKHVRANPQQGVEGAIIEKEAYLPISNVALYNPITKRADRVGIKEVDGKKVRYYKSNNEIVDV